ncbi:Purine nucleoside phosphorylase [hydrothermal vent metagenome]|uniref:purine-nucleoside phosphorylase n=1 Tax=hydrothermal vent metagenome TaxID=652676 RepID=A0A3B0SX44_9ZZZZ
MPAQDVTAQNAIAQNAIAMEVDRSVAAIKAAHKGEWPKVALILGSGLGKFGDNMEIETIISYDNIPDFPQPTVVGHAGRLLIGRVGRTPLLCMQGRMHLYEGHPAAKLAIPIRTFRQLGIEKLIITNAAGSLHMDMPAGSIMRIDDHINMSGHNPLTGPNDDRVGPRFFDMTEAYDVQMRDSIARSAAALDIRLHQGVYVQLAGPNFETPAEIRALGKLGIDAVGMSTVQECLVARHAGIKVAGLSLITNLGAGLSPNPLSHEETLSEAEKAYGDISRLLIHFIDGLSG